jgi:hypothetical protein
VILPEWHFYEEKEKLYNLMVEFSKFVACLPLKYRKNVELFFEEE